MIKVLLVDDHELVRSGIQALLSAETDIAVVAVCNCGEQALKVVETDPPDVILMDINMPGMGGVEACRRILAANPQIRIIGVSVHNDGPIPQQLLKLGVVGFVSKGSSTAEMVAAIKAVASGKRYLCQDVASNLAFQLLPGANPSPFLQLSSREAEVARLILSGKSIQEMSALLKINDKTINTYRYRLYGKLGIKNDVELTRLAVKYDYLDGV
ncbi:response regulator [Methylomonas sp. MED-D]|uniref:DNA-binding response regulator n=1 Tax=Methylomonas koyamae TaxID=702114 RepID=A0A177NHY2_9GAMM|nr:MULTISPECIES: response regulator [Methylomonas]MDT4332676.1 response regulator [Methylomonas sp. MV1]OAI17475.1 DNA-binding response regulator [Methylomonas koyamae]OHX34526.1 DNA-binding response regulator [Methylomonas sp. LWB]WGS85166.1 response regulator [Methylomonas sp. UP202]